MSQAAVQQRSVGDDILAQLRTNTDLSLNKLQEQAPLSEVALKNKLADLDAKMAEAAKIKDQEARIARTRILEAEFADVRAREVEAEKDLAQVMFGLTTSMQKIGYDYEAIQEPTAEEKRQKADAEQAVKNAELAKLQAEQDWYILPGGKARAVTKAETAIAAAKQKLAQVEANVAQSMRERLVNADMKESLQEFLAQTAKSTDIAQARLSTLLEGIRTSKMRKDEAFRIKEAAAKDLVRLDAELNSKEGLLHDEEQLLSNFVNGTPEYVQQEQKISNLRAEVEDLRGKRNVALVLMQNKETYIGQQAENEKTFMTLRDNHLALITHFKSAAEERAVLYLNRLEVMKGAADQEVMHLQNEVGKEIDIKSLEHVIQIRSASERRIAQMFESHRDYMRRLSQIQTNSAEAQANVRRRLQGVLEDFRKQYGIDPLDHSFFSHANDSAPPESGS